MRANMLLRRAALAILLIMPAMDMVCVGRNVTTSLCFVKTFVGDYKKIFAVVGITLSIAGLCGFSWWFDQLAKSIKEEQVCPEGKKLLHNIIENGELYKLKFLVQAKTIDVNEAKTFTSKSTFQFYSRLLIVAAQFGHEDMVKYLLDVGADPNVFDDVRCYSPLIAAAEKGNLKIVKLLVENKKKPANVNACGCYNNAAIVYAAAAGNTKIVKYLVDKGANKDQKSIAMLHAIYCGKCNVVEYLYGIGESLKGAMSEAARHGYKSIIDFCLKQGMDINDETECVLKNACWEVMTVYGAWDYIREKLVNSSYVDLNFIRYLVDEKGAKVTDKILKLTKKYITLNNRTAWNGGFLNKKKSDDLAEYLATKKPKLLEI